jgi:O-antigen/teichoic acid export membrane protein
MPLTSAFNTWAAFLSGKKDFYKTFTLSQASNLFYYSIMFVCIFIFPQTVTLVFANFLASAITNFLIYLRVSKKYVSNNLEDEGSIEYGKKLSVSSILPLISIHIDNILVFHLLGASNLAIYAFASNIPEKFISLIRPISTVALPKMSVKNPDNFRKELGSKISKLLLFSFLFSLIYILLAPFVYKILFPNYTDSILYSQVYVIAAAISTTTSLAVSFMFASRSNKIYTYNIINPIFNIAAMITGTYFFGIWGLIASRVMGNFFSLSLSYGLERKSTN